jgi:hypothetical protein
LVYTTKQSAIQVRLVVASYDYGVRYYERGSKSLFTSPLRSRRGKMTSHSNLTLEHELVSVSGIGPHLEGSICLARSRAKSKEPLITMTGPGRLICRKTDKCLPDRKHLPNVDILPRTQHLRCQLSKCMPNRCLTTV